jgi:GNAT superfamily N-acetyltransferase
METFFKKHKNIFKGLAISVIFAFLANEMSFAADIWGAKDSWHTLVPVSPFEPIQGASSKELREDPLVAEIKDLGLAANFKEQAALAYSIRYMEKVISLYEGIMSADCLEEVLKLHVPCEYFSRFDWAALKKESGVFKVPFASPGKDGECSLVYRVRREGGAEIIIEGAKKKGENVPASATLTADQAYDLLRKKDLENIDEGLIKAFRFAKYIEKYSIEKVVVVGSGLRNLPIFLSLMGKEVVFVDLEHAQTSSLSRRDRLLMKGLERRGAGAFKEVKYVHGEIGELDLAKEGIEAGSFDLVTFIDIIGPSPQGEPEQWFHKAKEMLKPEGYILLDENGSHNVSETFRDTFPSFEQVAPELNFQGEYNGPASFNSLYLVGKDQIAISAEDRSSDISEGFRWANGELLAVEGEGIWISGDIGKGKSFLASKMMDKNPAYETVSCGACFLDIKEQDGQISVYGKRLDRRANIIFSRLLGNKAVSLTKDDTVKVRWVVALDDTYNVFLANRMRNMGMDPESSGIEIIDVSGYDIGREWEDALKKIDARVFGEKREKKKGDDVVSSFANTSGTGSIDQKPTLLSGAASGFSFLFGQTLSGTRAKYPKYEPPFSEIGDKLVYPQGFGAGEDRRKEYLARVMEDLFELVEYEKETLSTPQKPMALIDIGGKRTVIYGTRASPVFYSARRKRYIKPDLLSHVRLASLFNTLFYLLKGDEVELILPFNYNPAPKGDSAWDFWHTDMSWQFAGKRNPYPEEIDPLVVRSAVKAIGALGFDQGGKEIVILDIFGGAGRMIRSLDGALKREHENNGGENPRAKYFLIDRNAKNIEHAAKALDGLDAVILQKDMTAPFDIEAAIGARPQIVTCEGGLTYQVVTRKDALMIAENVYRALAPGGVFIVTGYNPSLLTANDFKGIGFTVLNKSVPENILNYDRTAQLYILRKEEGGRGKKEEPAVKGSGLWAPERILSGLIAGVAAAALSYAISSPAPSYLVSSLAGWSDLGGYGLELVSALTMLGMVSSSSSSSSSSGDEADRPGKKRPRARRRSDGKESKWDLYQRFVEQLESSPDRVIRDAEVTNDTGKKRTILAEEGIENAYEVDAKYLISAISKIFGARRLERTQKKFIWAGTLKHGGQGRHLHCFEDQREHAGLLVKIPSSEEKLRYADLYSLNGARTALERLGGGLAADTMIIDARRTGKPLVFYAEPRRRMEAGVAIVQEKLLPLAEHLKRLARKGCSEKELQEAFGYIENFKALIVAMYKRGIVDSDRFDILGNYGIRTSDNSVAMLDLGEVTDSKHEAAKLVGNLDDYNGLLAEALEERDGVMLDSRILEYYRNNPLKIEDFVKEGKDLFGSEYDPEKAKMVFPYTTEEVQQYFAGQKLINRMAQTGSSGDAEIRAILAAGIVVSMLAVLPGVFAHHDFLMQVLGSATGLIASMVMLGAFLTAPKDKVLPIPVMASSLNAVGDDDLLEWNAPFVREEAVLTAEMAQLIARHAGIPEPYLGFLRKAGIAHDIGKNWFKWYFDSSWEPPVWVRNLFSIIHPEVTILVLKIKGVDLMPWEKQVLRHHSYLIAGKRPRSDIARRCNTILVIADQLVARYLPRKYKKKRLVEYDHDLTIGWVKRFFTPGKGISGKGIGVLPPEDADLIGAIESIEASRDFRALLEKAMRTPGTEDGIVLFADPGAEYVPGAWDELVKAFASGGRLAVEITAIERYGDTGAPSGFVVSYQGVKGFVHKNDTGVDFNVPIEELGSFIGINVELPVLDPGDKARGIEPRFSMLERHMQATGISQPKERESVKKARGKRRQTPKKQYKRSKVNRLTYKALKEQAEDNFFNEDFDGHLPDGSPLEIFRILRQEKEFVFPEDIRLRTKGKMPDRHLSVETVKRDLGTLFYLGLVDKFGLGEDSVYAAMELSIEDWHVIEALLAGLGTRPGAAEKEAAREHIAGLFRMTEELDKRPSEAKLLHPVYISDDMAIRAMVNPDSLPLTAVYGGAGTDISNFLLSTDATEGYFVSHNEDLKVFEAPEIDAYMSLEDPDGVNDIPEADAMVYRRKFSLGFSTAWNIISADERILALALELEAIGASDVKVDLHEGFPRLSFKWAYYGERQKEREITFIEADMTDPASYPPLLGKVFERGVDIYYQRAALRMPKAYLEENNFIEYIHGHLKGGGFFVTDDQSFREDGLKSLENYTPRSKDFPIELEAISVPGRSLRARVISYLRRGMASKSYGWELSVRRKEKTPLIFTPDAHKRKGLRRDQDNGEPVLRVEKGVYRAKAIHDGDPAVMRQIAERITDIQLETGQYYEALFGVGPQDVDKEALTRSNLENMTGENKEILLAVDGGAIAGFVFFTTGGERGKQNAELRNISVAQELQGKGFGSLLLDAAVDAFRQAGIKKFILSTKNKKIIGYFVNRSIAAEDPKGPWRFFIKRDYIGDDYMTDITVEIYDKLGDDLTLEEQFRRDDENPLMGGLDRTVWSSGYSECPTLHDLFRGHFRDKESIKGYDFGASVGWITEDLQLILKEMFRKVDFMGIEKDPLAVEAAKGEGTPVVNGDVRELADTLMPASTDLVTMTNPDPRTLADLVAAAKKILSPDGLIIINFSTQDMDSLMKEEKVYGVEAAVIRSALTGFRMTELDPDARAWETYSEQYPDLYENLSLQPFLFVYSPAFGVNDRGFLRSGKQALIEQMVLRVREECGPIGACKVHALDLARRMTDSGMEARVVKHKEHVHYWVESDGLVIDPFPEGMLEEYVSAAGSLGDERFIIASKNDPMVMELYQGTEDASLTREAINNKEGDLGFYIKKQDLVSRLLRERLLLLADRGFEEKKIYEDEKVMELKAMLSATAEKLAAAQYAARSKVEGTVSPHDKPFIGSELQEDYGVSGRQEVLSQGLVNKEDTKRGPGPSNGEIAQAFVDAVIKWIEVRAVETGVRGENLVIGIDTSWIPREQRNMSGMQMLLKRIEALSKSKIKGFQRVKVCISDDPAVLAKQVWEARKTGGIDAPLTPLSNIVLIGEDKVLTDDMFRSFKGPEDEDGAFFAKVLLPDGMTEETDVDLIFLTSEVLRKVSGMKSGRELYVRLPDAGRFPIHELAEIYKARSEALIRA